MAKIFTTKIDRFNGGMVGDPRDPREAVCRGASNMDLFSYPHRMIPRFASEDGDDEAEGVRKQNYALAILTGTTYNLFSLGLQAASITRAKISRKTLLTTGTEGLADASWTDPTNSSAGQNTTSMNLFVTYRNKTTGKDFIYGAHTGTHIWAFDPTSVAVFNDTAFAMNYTNVEQGLVHSKDDILYVPHDNVIAKKDGGTTAADNWTDDVLVLPTDLKIKSIAEYGNYLAIACIPVSTQSMKSVVYLWDRDSSLTTLSEMYDWGNERIAFIETIDGILVGASLKGGVASSQADYVSFKYLSASGFKEFERFRMGNASTLLPSMRQKADGRIYFQLYGRFDDSSGPVREGLWSISRTSEGFAVTQEYTPNNVTALTGGQALGFLIVNDFVFQSYLDSSSYDVSKTQEGTIYTTGIYESNINPQIPSPHKDKKKQLMGARVSYEKLAASDTVLMYYKVDGGSWTAIGTASTDSTLYLEKTSDSTFNQFTSGTEYEFKLESTHGAIITAFTYKYSLIATEI